MKRRIRIIALILLIFNAISAIVGGIALIAEPSGESIEMPLSLLEYAPFDSFLIPGIILLVMNGLLSVLFAILVMCRVRNSSWLVMIQGGIMLGWLLVQIAMIRDYDMFFHTLYLAAGAGLLAAGYGMRSGGV